MAEPSVDPEHTSIGVVMPPIDGLNPVQFLDIWLNLEQSVASTGQAAARKRNGRIKHPVPEIRPRGRIFGMGY